MVRLFGLFLLIAGSSTPIDTVNAPFGVEMGVSLELFVEEYGATHKEAITYFLESVPDPDPRFSKYTVSVGTEVGACSVGAQTGPLTEPQFMKLREELIEEIEVSWEPYSRFFPQMPFWFNLRDSNNGAQVEKIVMIHSGDEDAGHRTIFLSFDFKNSEEC